MIFFSFVALLTSHHRDRGLWKPLSEVNSARNYCGTAISFLCFCLAAVNLEWDALPTVFTVRQRLALKKYQEHLTTVRMASEEDVPMFQTALASVLFREQEMDIDIHGKLACPVQSYMAILALRSVGNFVPARLVTQPISRLMYASRAMALRLTLGKAKSGEKRFLR